MTNFFKNCIFTAFGGDTLKCIKCFLDNRKQPVVINGITSDSIPVSSDVPQGYVLGLISSLPDANILQDDLSKLDQWEKSLDMNFNHTKCQVLHITR